MELNSEHMSNISVAEILKMHGAWIEAVEFVSLIHDKLKVSERHAYNLIKKAWKNKEVLKVNLQNSRTILYGLPEFGQIQAESSSREEPLIKTLSFQEAFFYDCFKELKEISKLNSSVNSLEAMYRIRSLIVRLPEDMQKKLVSFFKEKWKSLMEKWNKEVVGFRDPLTGAPEVDFMIGRISQLLHRQVSGEKRGVEP